MSGAMLNRGQSSAMRIKGSSKRWARESSPLSEATASRSLQHRLRILFQLFPWFYECMLDGTSGGFYGRLWPVSDFADAAKSLFEKAGGAVDMDDGFVPLVKGKAPAVFLEHSP